MIDPKAFVHPSARIAKDADVGPFSVIGPNVEIGSGSVIAPHVVVGENTRIGRNNRIFQFASIGDIPQDKKYNGEETRLEIGDGNTIRECVTINRGTIQDAGVTRIGSRNWIMAYVHIAHDCVLGNDIIMANQATLGGHVHIDDFVIMGGFSGIHQYCHIGAHAFLQHSAHVTRDIPPYVMVGQDARPHGINHEGLRRRGFDMQRRRTLMQAYRILYRDGLRLEEARGQLRDLAGSSDDVAVLHRFLEQSSRSIIR